MSVRLIYCRLLRLYPPDYRAFFAAEMAAAFDEALIDERCRRLTGFIALVFAELTGLLIGACREWMARLAYSLSHTNGYIGGGGLPDRLLMRPPGIGWETYYGRGTTCSADEVRDEAGPCLNGYQTFGLACPLRRLFILVFGSGCCCSRCH